jgi:lipoprotein-anchoring transpeptidase ErfK/SrfK
MWGLGAFAVAAGAALVVALQLVPSGSTAGRPAPSAHVAAAAHSPSVAATTVPLSFTVAPADGSVDQPLDSRVAVTTSGGTLLSVEVSTPGGPPLAGSLNPAGWQSTAPLAPHAHYTVTAQATDEAGQTVQHVSTFTTLTPTAVLRATVTPTDGETVGVGMPISVRFNHSVIDKAAVVAALHVTMSAPVALGWRWFSDRELHFRPEVYWPAGERVTFTAALAGVDAGGGIWAEADQAVHFAVGDSHIATANVTTHEMTVTTNGQVVATYPLSAGRTQYPTMAGVHIALYRQYDVLMDSSTVGIPRNSPDGYYEHVYWDVNISDGGEFVHAAPWSVGAQGRSNVSHGCINLSVANATAFFSYSRVGDVVQVLGSPRPASVDDHGTMDWTTPWDVWAPAV